MTIAIPLARGFIAIGCIAAWLAASGRAEAVLLQVSGNSSGPLGPIQLWVLPPPSPLGPPPPTDQFVPDGALVPGANGRAWASDQVQYYYSELGPGRDPSDGIHVVPISPGIFGGNDSTIFANPNPATGIQDLDVSIVDKDLYALTGYPSAPPTVFRLSRVDGHVIGSPVVLKAPASPDSDGFTVLPNGNFLLNIGDASPVYQEFSSLTGDPVGAGFAVPCLTATGVDAGLSSLVIQCDFNSFLVTTLTGVVLEKYLVTTNRIEDIEGIFGPDLPSIPEPTSLMLLVAGVGGLALISRGSLGRDRSPASVGSGPATKASY